MNLKTVVFSDYLKIISLYAVHDSTLIQISELNRKLFDILQRDSTKYSLLNTHERRVVITIAIKRAITHSRLNMQNKIEKNEEYGRHFNFSIIPLLHDDRRGIQHNEYIKRGPILAV